MRDFSPEGLREKHVYLAEADGEIVAWAALVAQGEVCSLDDLWVEPEWLGKGIGTRLFLRVAERARELGACRMEWEAEPNAVGFYEKMGARRLRDSEPGEWGRILPVMGIDVPLSGVRSGCSGSP